MAPLRSEKLSDKDLNSGDSELSRPENPSQTLLGSNAGTDNNDLFIFVLWSKVVQ